MLKTLHRHKHWVAGGGVLIGLGALAYGNLFSPHTTEALLPEHPGIYREWQSNTQSGVVVNEKACNGNGTYDSTDTLGARDSYQVDLSSVPDGAIITKIKIFPCASRNQANDAKTVMNVFYLFNNTQSANKGNYVLTGTTPRPMGATVFGGLSLPVITSAARASGRTNSTLEIGAVLMSGTGGARLSRISTVISYTSLSPNAKTVER